MSEWSAATRRQALDEMASRQLDVLVIGGGITGVGTALDAAARGYRVGLIEREDYASGTSSRSTKLVHGGIRYLPQFDLPLVREALLERGRLLRNAPHLVRPLAFILPLYGSSRHPVGMTVAPPKGIGLDLILDTGLFMYDELAGKENVGRHRRIDPEEALARAKCLTGDDLKTGFVYYDAQTDDARLTLAVMRTAVDYGALAANYTAATRFYRDADGRIAGVYVRQTLDPVGDGELLLRARHVVNATGVWAEETERLAGDAPNLSIAPSKGTHLVMSREALDLGDEAIVLPETADGRIIFIVPWLTRALVGTTDDGVDRIGDPVANDEEIDYLLGHLNKFIRRKVSRDDIVATYSGYRPLLRLRKGRTPSRLSRTHTVVESADGLVTVSGGKLTTYRVMAQDVMDRIDAREDRKKRHVTLNLRLRGGKDLAFSRERVEARARRVGLPPAITAHLLRTYGDDAEALLAVVEGDTELASPLIADLPNVCAEVVYACRQEMALTVEDALARRTRIALEDSTRGLSVSERVATLMARELGWSEADKRRRITDYYEYAIKQAGPLAGRLEGSFTGQTLS
ncbi:MAG TPA: glycerol-3-phosphate dehydrogenase/oxidase [Ktedonobacterales bacterium]